MGNFAALSHSSSSVAGAIRLVSADTIGRMSADRVHLVRHGEVENPDRVLYERLPGFGLSRFGVQLAQAAARGIPIDEVKALFVSPLQRAVESVKPWEKATGLKANVDERLIEPWNEFRGLALNGGRTFFGRPDLWRFLVNPFRPSWGEPYSQIARRMLAVMREAADSVDRGDVVLVTHQLPIWMVHLSMADKPLVHLPNQRRCSLSSITSFRVSPNGFDEYSYLEPSDLGSVIDEGAA